MKAEWKAGSGSHHLFCEEAGSYENPIVASIYFSCGKPFVEITTELLPASQWLYIVNRVAAKLEQLTKKKGKK